MIEDIEKLVKHISHGVYIIGVRHEQRENAFTAAWVMQVSFQPLMICLSINPEHYSYSLLKKGGICTLNVLGRHQLTIAEHFGNAAIKDKMQGFQWHKAVTGAPVLSESLSYFDCRVSHFSDAGDHKLAVCEVLDAGFLNPGEIMLYTDTDNMDNSEEIFQRATD